MTTSEQTRFLNLWRQIERDQKDLDFRKSKLAREVRDTFPSGAVGDRKFIAWWKEEMGMTDVEATKILQHARAAALVPDVKTWNEFGGSKQIERVLELPKREQPMILKQAQASGELVRDVIKQRAAANVAPYQRTALTHEKMPNISSASLRTDITELANFVAKSGVKLTGDIRVIVDMYKTVRN